MTKFQRLAPSMFLATGIIIATVAGSLVAEQGWWVLIGPGMLTAFLVGARVLESKLLPGHSGDLRPAYILSLGFLVASALMALRDPQMVVSMIPIFGACSIAGLTMDTKMRCGSMAK